MGEYGPAIAGYGSLVGGWTGGPAQAEVQSNALTFGALSVELPVPMAEGRDLLLDPPTFQKLELQLLYLGPVAPTGIIFLLSLIDEPDPPQFSADDDPSDQYYGYGSRFLGGYVTTSAVAENTPFSAAIDLSEVYSVYRSCNWLGRLNFLWTCTVRGSPLTVTRIKGIGDPGEATLVTDELTFVTGISGPVRARARVDRCGRCGLLDTVDHFREDGWSKGLLVCKECWDPEEPPPKEESLSREEPL